MTKKNKKHRSGVVYSTHPEYDYNYASENEDEELERTEQNLRVSHDRKKRGGKTVTLVTGFVGPEEALKDLGRLLKSKCGVGGSAKDGEIIIQGEWKDKVRDILIQEGFTRTKTTGG